MQSYARERPAPRISIERAKVSLTAYNNADSVCIKIQVCNIGIAHHDCLARVAMIAEPQGLFVQLGAVLRG